MSNKLENYDNLTEFNHQQTSKLFEEFKTDRVSNEESFKLIEMYSKKNTEKIVKVIIDRMCN